MSIHLIQQQIQIKPDVYVCRIKTVPVDFCKLSNVVYNDVVNKTVYDELLTKVNVTDSSE